MNETIEAFGFPNSLIAEFEYWVVLLRPAQPTLGSLILAAKSDAEAFADLPAAAFGELGAAISAIERTLKQVLGYEKINYLMLMMVDRHVHFHVIPRYEGVRSAKGISIVDAGWPKAPALNEAVKLTADQIAALREWIGGDWQTELKP